MESESVTPVSVQADLRVSADAASNGTGAVPMSGGSAAAPRISGPELAVAASRPSAEAGICIQPDDELSIAGGISRKNGRPILDVVLTLVNPRGQPVSRTTSDLHVRYHIAAPVSGTYALIASAHGCQPVAGLRCARPRGSTRRHPDESCSRHRADRQPAEASTARLDLGRAERVEMLPPAVAPPFDLEVMSQA
jgi:hypothetical protein